MEAAVGSLSLSLEAGRQAGSHLSWRLLAKSGRGVNRGYLCTKAELKQGVAEFLCKSTRYQLTWRTIYTYIFFL